MSRIQLRECRCDLRACNARLESRLLLWQQRQGQTQRGSEWTIPDEKPAPGKMTQEQLLALEQAWLDALLCFTSCIISNEDPGDIQACIDRCYAEYCRRHEEITNP